MGLLFSAELQGHQEHDGRWGEDEEPGKVEAGEQRSGVAEAEWLFVSLFRDFDKGNEGGNQGSEREVDVKACAGLVSLQKDTSKCW